MTFRTLVSAEALAAHVDDASWRIFDCRHDLTQPDAGEHAFVTGHIPAAQFLHLDRDLSGPKHGKNGRHPLPDPALLAATLARCGVSNATQVVAYDNVGGMFAARLWWLLRWLGHDNVAVLDGGLPAWERHGGLLTDKATPRAPAVFDWRTGDQAVGADFVRANLRQPHLRLIDARAPDRFRGENETLDPVGGHIPGAVNRFFKDSLTADNHFRPAAQLRDDFDRLLSHGQRPVCYCGSGVTACHLLLAMEISGLKDARLYAGSWSEWCSDAQRPTATGAE